MRVVGAFIVGMNRDSKHVSAGYWIAKRLKVVKW